MQAQNVKLVVFLVLLSWMGCSKQSSSKPDVMDDDAVKKSDSSKSSGPKQGDKARGVATKLLIQQGWTGAATRAVAGHNQRYLQLIFEEDSSQFDQTVGLLARLGQHPYAQQQLVEMPELAGLLAGSLEQDANGPELILKTIPSGVDRDLVLSLYCLSAMPSDCLSLAATLQSDRDIVIRLCKRDAIDAVVWLTSIPTDQAAATAYRHWVRSVLDFALNKADDNELDRAQTMLAIHAPTIRGKFEKEPDFRQEFLVNYWPGFSRTLSEQTDELGWGIFVSEPRVWDFLEKFDAAGQKLYSTHGPLAVDLLLAKEYRDCQKQILEALTLGDEFTIQSLFDTELRSQPLFVKLLRRNLPGGTLAKALHTLASRLSDVPRMLSKWDDLSDAALIEDLGPPPEGPRTWLPGYNIYYLGKKIAQGRDVTRMDVVFTAVDTVEVAFMAKGAGKGLKVIQQGVKKDLAKRGFREAAEGVSKLSSRELFPWVLREGHRACRLAFRSIRDCASVDVTGAVRFAFEKSGTGRRTFKELSGLEARVFMRADRRVALDLTSLVESNHVVGRALRESAINAGFDVSLNTRPGEAAAESAVESGVAAKAFSEEQLKAWREHIAIWWLAANDGSLEHCRWPASNQANEREEARSK